MSLRWIVFPSPLEGEGGRLGRMRGSSRRFEFLCHDLSSSRVLHRARLEDKSWHGLVGERTLDDIPVAIVFPVPSPPPRGRGDQSKRLPSCKVSPLCRYQCSRGEGSQTETRSYARECGPPARLESFPRALAQSGGMSLTHLNTPRNFADRSTLEKLRIPRP